MASEDVIELGSSEDEAEPPAPKKIKPLPNAMVHIPNKLRGITIKPMVTNLPHKHKVFMGKSLSVTKLPQSTTVNLIQNTNRHNGIPLHKYVSKPIYRKLMTDKPVPNQDKLNINPFNIANRGSALLNRTPSSKFIKRQLKVQDPKVLNNLPSSITVKRTQGGGKVVPVASAQTVNKVTVKKNLTLVPSKTLQKDHGSSIGDVLTVELDDDEGSQSSTATGSPQWYLRPEEQLDENSLEQKNNKEPEASNMIEILIEDSPVKPCLPKDSREVSNELFITIEDSPIKPFNDASPACDSDNEQDKTKVPLSKKKLNYPDNKALNENEMEADNDSTVNKSEVNNDTEEDKVENDSENVVQQTKQLDENNKLENTNSPTVNPIMVKKDNSLESDLCSNDKSIEVPSKNVKSVCSNENSEFHPIYQKFIDLCFELENSDDMNKIVEKKIKTYYRQVSKEYVESEEFIDMVSTKITLMKAGPQKMFLYIKDIVDELNLQRKMAKSQPLLENKKESVKELNKDLFEEDKPHDRKRRRQIHKLEKTIKKLHRAIQKLEEQEVDFDDEEDSVYLLTERYKERLVRVYAKFCQISNTKMPSEPRIQIECRPGQPSGPARKLEKWINKKVPIGTPLPFPDFHDVLKCVREANEEDQLGWNEADIMEEARDLFTRCGKKLQRRRQENEWRLAASRITQDVDPAEQNEMLKKKLDENKMVAAKKETELFNKYADKQNLLKLEAVEIGDKEADESPVESEEDEINDDSNSLEDRQKRKDRLRRLLNEKSKRVTDEKVSDSKKESEKLSLLSESETDNVKALHSKEGCEPDNCRESEINDNIEKCYKNLNTRESEVDKDNKNLTEVTSEGVKRNKIQQNESATDTVVEDITDNNNKNENTAHEVNDMKTTGESDSITPTDMIKPEPKVYDTERVTLISDDSDVDELNLLQKLHSGNEISSSDSSEYDSPIAISDTLESNSDSEDNETHDVISIENSSYSESETAKEDIMLSVNDIAEKCSKVGEDVVIYNLEDESQNADSVDSVVEADKEYSEKSNKDNDEMEDVLLASSEDEDITHKDIDLSKGGSGYINLKDDAISIESNTDEVPDEKRNEMLNDDLNDGKSDCNVHIHYQEDVSELKNIEKHGDESEEMDIIETTLNEDQLQEPSAPLPSANSDINLKDDAISIESNTDEVSNEKRNEILNDDVSDDKFDCNLHIHSQEDISQSKKIEKHGDGAEAMDITETTLNDDELQEPSSPQPSANSDINLRDDAISIESNTDEVPDEKRNEMLNDDINDGKSDCNVHIHSQEDVSELKKIEKHGDGSEAMDIIGTSLNKDQLQEPSAPQPSANSDINLKDDAISIESNTDEVLDEKRNEMLNDDINDDKSDCNVHIYSQEDVFELNEIEKHGDGSEAMDIIETTLNDDQLQGLSAPQPSANSGEIGEETRIVCNSQDEMVTCVDNAPLDCLKDARSKTVESTENDVNMSNISNIVEHHSKSTELTCEKNANDVEMLLQKMFDSDKNAKT
ncbi:unnamed protein product [Parnassius apollo]|uniref:(apollo) hypothetical protein n=1 Tax=Parnassius apollo TaxID=110799 RepID=A0A8S3XY55_PARAO|nr:unnamed protein product [Parnassius apollo]